MALQTIEVEPTIRATVTLIDPAPTDPEALPATVTAREDYPAGKWIDITGALDWDDVERWADELRANGLRTMDVDATMLVLVELHEYAPGEHCPVEHLSDPSDSLIRVTFCHAVTGEETEVTDLFNYDAHQDWAIDLEERHQAAELEAV